MAQETTEPDRAFKKVKPMVIKLDNHDIFLKGVENFLENSAYVHHETRHIPDEYVPKELQSEGQIRSTIMVLTGESRISFKKDFLNFLQTLCASKIKPIKSEQAWADLGDPVQVSIHWFKFENKLLRVILFNSSEAEFEQAYSNLWNISFSKNKPYDACTSIGI
ncbi:MAG: hypothetical protein QG566_206 [Patescibacteria group bacterium]|jgi:hypothetical protein|nr:hypothetical protein [Patescibacteria group bacterium]